MDINTSQFMMMYSLYSWPNVFLCFVGGFLMDKVLGLRWGAIIFATLVTLGQCVSALGAQFNSYAIVLAGRFIFGSAVTPRLLSVSNFVLFVFVLFSLMGHVQPPPPPL